MTRHSVMHYVESFQKNPTPTLRTVDFGVLNQGTPGWINVHESSKGHEAHHLRIVRRKPGG